SMRSIVLRSAVDRIDDAEFLRQLAGLAESADDLAIEPNLVDLTMIHALWIVRVGAVQILSRTPGNADGLRCADVGDLRLERTLPVEHLDAMIARVGDVDIARGIASNTANLVELSLRRSGLPPRFREVAVLVEFCDAI